MKVLISPISEKEAHIVLEGGADIIDIKNVAEGSLGAQFPWVIRAMAQLSAAREVESSATLGDLPYKPGTAALAARGAASCGVNYLKAGLHGVSTYEQALEMITAVIQAAKEINPQIKVVAAGYADFRRFGGLDTQSLLRAAIDAHADVVMVDTAIKDGKTLLDAMSQTEIQDFVDQAHAAALQVALAGSVGLEHIAQLYSIGPDIVGVRGAVCEGRDRQCGISLAKVKELVTHIRNLGRTQAELVKRF